VKKFSVVDLLNANICGEYTRNRIIEIWGEHPERSVREISEIGVHVDDRLWMVSRLLPTDVVLRWAREFATSPEEGSHRIERAYHYWSTAKKEAAAAIAFAVATTAVDTLDHIAIRRAAESTGRMSAATDHGARKDIAADKDATTCYRATWAKTKRDILSVMLDRLVELGEDHEAKNG